jgi:hypothetical protein
MTAADLDTARRTITGLIHQHMPTAAVASGMASAVDPGPWVAWVSGLVRHVDRPRELGLTALTAWLKTRGFEAGPAFVKALRHEWILVELAVESRRGPVACFADVAVA